MSVPKFKRKVLRKKRNPISIDEDTKIDEPAREEKEETMVEKKSAELYHLTLTVSGIIITDTAVDAAEEEVEEMERKREKEQKLEKKYYLY